MMIELQKYSKIDEDHLLKRVQGKHTDSRLKVIGYVSLAVVVSLLGLTYTLGRTMFMSSDERALKIFNDDTNSEVMKAYVNFIAEYGKTYVDRTETARKYRNFKNNYQVLQKFKTHENHMPFKITLNNQYADLSGEEFIASLGNSAIVPENVLTPQNEDGSSIFLAR